MPPIGGGRRGGTEDTPEYATEINKKTKHHVQFKENNFRNPDGKRDFHGLVDTFAWDKSAQTAPSEHIYRIE